MEYLASLELALQNEESEMKFYLDQSARSRNPLAKKMFAELAREEKEHMTRIRALHERLQQSGEWPQEVPLQVAGTNVKKVLEGLAAKAASAGDHDDDDVRALQRAIEFEARGARFYADIAGQAASPAEKNFFEFLSHIEREHQLSLADSLAYLKDPQGWLRQHERSGLDGA